MPELPEVETTCRGIKESLEGKVINGIVIRTPSLRWPIPSLLSKLSTLKINTVQRRAKYILLNSDLGTIIIHLGMTGRLRILSSKIKAEKHDHVDFKLNDGIIMRYTDPRRFGAILWTDQDPLQHPLLAKLGPEPLLKIFSPKYLFNFSKNRSIAIKKLLMDQKIVVGVGNIYANEALFLSKVSPNRLSNTLTECECKTIVTNIKTVLKKAIRQGGTTLRNFFGTDDKPGYFKQKLMVYGRAGKPCFICHQPLNGIFIGQRQTVYCSSCQI